MKLQYTISEEEYLRLKGHSDMLGRICAVVSRFAHTPETTTYQCVVSLNERVRTLNKKIRDHKNAGGKFLKRLPAASGSESCSEVVISQLNSLCGKACLDIFDDFPISKDNVKGDSQPPEGERGSKTAHSNEDGAPTQSGAGVDVPRLVSLLNFGGGSSECEGHSVATEDQDDNCVLIPFLALLWMPPEYCRQQVQSEPVPHLLIPRRLYDNQRVNRLLEKLAVKLSEIYPDSFLLSTHPLRLKYRNQPYHWWQISLPHFVNLVQRILCIDSGDLIKAGMSLTVSSHAIWRQTQEPKLNMSSGIAAYEYHELAKKESASGENFWANAHVEAQPSED